MKNSLIDELIQTWDVMAATEEGAAPARRETLRACADTLRMLLTVTPTIDHAQPPVSAASTPPAGLNERERFIWSMGHDAALASPAAPAPADWRGFIESCAQASGGMVNGNRLAMQAKALLASPAASDLQAEQGDRALFEAWFISALRKTYPQMPESGVQLMLSKRQDGTYGDMVTQHDWSVWQASVVRAATAVAGSIDGQLTSLPPAAKEATTADQQGDTPLSEYAPGQWWLASLEALWGHRQVDLNTYRAAKVACNFAAAVFAQRSAAQVDEAQRERVRDAIAEALGNAYDCTRVWSAWSYNTMGPDDFSAVANDGERLNEITDAAIAAMNAPPAA